MNRDFWVGVLVVAAVTIALFEGVLLSGVAKIQLDGCTKVSETYRIPLVLPDYHPSSYNPNRYGGFR